MNYDQYFTEFIVFFPFQAVEFNSYVMLQQDIENPITSETNKKVDEIPCGQKSEKFWEIFEKELKIINDKTDKKVWSEREDELLVELRENGLGWRDISRNIEGTKDQICKRRYYHLIMEDKKWPKEIDVRMKTLCEVEDRSWKYIFRVLKKEFGIEDRKRLEEFKIRYLLYLKSDICKEPWKLSEDFKLMNFVRENGRKWRKLSKIFVDRTELQLKNRYYGTLLPIELRVSKMLEGSVDAVN